MGCGSSSGQVAQSRQLKCRLTESQIGVVQDTWPLLSKEPVEVGLQTFAKLFELSPELKPYFFGVSADSDVPMDSPRLHAHAGAFMDTLGVAVESLNDTERLVELLTHLGQNHIPLGVDFREFKKLWPAVDLMLKDRLMYAYSINVREAWGAIFEFIVEKMENAVKQSLETSPSSTSNAATGGDISDDKHHASGNGKSATNGTGRRAKTSNGNKVAAKPSPSANGHADKSNGASVNKNGQSKRTDDKT